MIKELKHDIKGHKNVQHEQERALKAMTGEDASMPMKIRHLQ